MINVEAHDLPAPWFTMVKRNYNNTKRGSIRAVVGVQSVSTVLHSVL